MVPVAAGGSADKLTRLIAERLTERWGQSVVVENLGGASGTIGAARVAKSPADGYTLLVRANNEIAINKLVTKKVKYDIKDFTAIRLFTNPEGWIANFTDNDIAARFPRHEALAEHFTQTAAPHSQESA